MQANQSQNTSNEAIFGFMSQAPVVQALLNASVAALPRLPQPERDVLANALRRFENFGVPTLWAPNDVESVDGVELTLLEKREAVERFLEDYSLSQQDWNALESSARDVLRERRSYVRVEYDPLYTGGDYSGTGQFAYLPMDLVEVYAQKEQGGDGVSLAFAEMIKLDPMHIVHYNFDELYNEHEELIP